MARACSPSRGTGTLLGSGVPSKTLTTQSEHAGPATWQESQSITMNSRLGKGSDTAPPAP